MRRPWPTGGWCAKRKKMRRVKQCNVNLFFVNVRYGLMQRVLSMDTYIEINRMEGVVGNL